MRKMISLLITLLIMLSIFTVKPFAKEQSLEKDLSTQSLYVLSPSINRDAILYADYEKYNVFLSLKDVMGENFYELQGEHEVSYGSAFKLNDIDYIPIVVNNKIIALLAILETNGEYSWTLSEGFSEELNKIAKLTSKETPAMLYTENGNVYATVAGGIYQLTFHPEVSELNRNLGYHLNLKEQSDVINVLNTDDKNTIKLENILYETKANLSAGARYLSLDLKETQGKQTWCSAFAGAQMMRYRGKGNIYAKAIMKYFYPKVGDTDLKTKSISNKQLIEYARTKKSYPIKVASTLSEAAVRKQIDSSKPIYLGCEGTGTYKKRRHALVLRGYNRNTKSYSVWNPWDAKYVAMSMSSKSIAVKGGKFIWDATIYNW